MEYELYFKNVESVLKQYPTDFRKNYYNNKRTVKIEKKELLIANHNGTYDNETNIIELNSESALTHELFHMAFRNEKNVGKKIFKDYDLYYDNGISIIKYMNGKPYFYERGLTEGFAEYLSRKCSDVKGQNFNYFFTNLLIAIYGEEILKYPLTNDPYGFLQDDRFLDIIKYGKELDILDDAIQTIQIVVTMKEFFENHKEDVDKKEIAEIFANTKNNYKSSIIHLFELIIEEYKNYPYNLSKEEFVVMLEDFLNNSDYSPAFGLDDDKISVKQEVTSIINKLKKEKTKKYI